MEGEIDVLSEVLRVMRLSGAIHFNAEFTRPWAVMTSPPDLLAARLMPGAESITLFHLATSGSCWIACGKLDPIKIETGDVIVFARGDQHVMASDVGLAPVPVASIFPKASTEQITLVRYGGGGEQGESNQNPHMGIIMPQTRRLVSGPGAADWRSTPACAAERRC